MLHRVTQQKWEHCLVSQRPCKTCAVCSRCTEAVIPERNEQDDCKTQLLTFSKSGTISGMWLIHHRWGTPPELQQEWHSSIQTWILALQQIHVSDWFQRNTEFKACLKKLLWLFFHHQASRIGSIAAKVVEVIPAVWWDTSKAFWAETAESIRSFFPRMLAWSRSLKTDPVPCSSYNSSVLRILPCRQRQQGIL